MHLLPYVFLGIVLGVAFDRLVEALMPKLAPYLGPLPAVLGTGLVIWILIRLGVFY